MSMCLAMSLTSHRPVNCLTKGPCTPRSCPNGADLHGVSRGCEMPSFVHVLRDADPAHLLQMFPVRTVSEPWSSFIELHIVHYSRTPDPVQGFSQRVEEAWP